jgi:hypothetical protein
MTPSYRVQARANHRQRLASNLRPHIVGEMYVNLSKPTRSRAKAERIALGARIDDPNAIRAMKTKIVWRNFANLRPWPPKKKS